VSLGGAGLAGGGEVCEAGAGFAAGPGAPEDWASAVVGDATRLADKARRAAHPPNRGPTLAFEAFRMNDHPEGAAAGRDSPPHSL